MLAENVIMLNNTPVYDEIQKFLDRKYLISGSDRTREEYGRDIRQFFKYLRDKDVEHLTIDDIQLKQDDIEDYQLYLVKLNKYANSTINRKIVPVRELYKRFERKKIVNDISMFSDIKSLKVTDEEGSGILSEEELNKILNYIKTRPKAKKREIQYHLIKFSVETRARIDECLSVKWSDFEIRSDSVVVKIIGKGNKLFQPRISRKFYDELLEIKIDGNDKVFDISITAVNSMMKSIRENLGFEKERNISFHSFRKTGGSYIYQTTKDIEYTRKALNHSSISTTQRYIESIDYGIFGMFSMQQDYNEELYRSATLEQLIEVIDNLEPVEKMRINLKLKEMAQKEE